MNSWAKGLRSSGGSVGYWAFRRSKVKIQPQVNCFLHPWIAACTPVIASYISHIAFWIENKKNKKSPTITWFSSLKCYRLPRIDQRKKRKKNSQWPCIYLSKTENFKTNKKRRKLNMDIVSCLLKIENEYFI